MQREPDVGFLGHGDHGLEEVRDIGPHLVERVRPFFRQRRQIFHPLVIEAGPPGAGAARLLEVTLHRAVRVPVVFDDRQPDVARGFDRLDDLFDVGVLPGPVVDRVREAGDHQVCDRQAVCLVTVHHLFQPRLLPGNLSTPGDDVLDPQLPDAACRRGDSLIRRDAGSGRPSEPCFEADLRRVLAFEMGTDLDGRGRPGRRRRRGNGQRCGTGRLQHRSSGGLGAHERHY